MRAARAAGDAVRPVMESIIVFSGWGEQYMQSGAYIAVENIMRRTLAAWIDPFNRLKMTYSLHT